MGKERAEGLAVDGDHVHARQALHGGVPWPFANHGDLPETLPGPKPVQDDVALAGYAPGDFHLALHDHVEPVAAIALPADRHARLEVLAPHGHARAGLELHDVEWQDQVERPVGGHSDLAVQAGKLEIFTPMMSATAERWPSDPILPSALNENASRAPHAAWPRGSEPGTP